MDFCVKPNVLKCFKFPCKFVHLSLVYVHSLIYNSKTLTLVALVLVVGLFLCHKDVSCNAEFLSIFISVPNKQLRVCRYVLNGAVVDLSVELESQ